MKQAAIILVLLVAVTGCSRPAETAGDTAVPSRFDIAIENLSLTACRMDSIRREKDFFVELLEDFELQKDEYSHILDSPRLRRQMRNFDKWHSDILQRERQLEMQHALNVFAAHNQVIKRKFDDPNRTVISIAAPAGR